MPQHEEIPKKDLNKDCLSLEDFSFVSKNGAIAFHNFLLFFLDNFSKERLGEKKYLTISQNFGVKAYERFCKDHPRLNTQLKKISKQIQQDRMVKNSSAITQTLKDNASQFYKAYKIMRQYGASDEDLSITSQGYLNE